MHQVSNPWGMADPISVEMIHFAAAMRRARKSPSSSSMLIIRSFISVGMVTVLLLVAVPAMLDAPLSDTPRRDYWPSWPVTRIRMTPLKATSQGCAGPGVAAGRRWPRWRDSFSD